MRTSGPHVAIIGGGIIGCSAAAYLAEAGASVSLFERTGLGAGASGRNLGAIQHPFDPVLTELHHRTLDLYGALSGEDLGFAFPYAPAGLLLLNADADAARRQTERMALVLPQLQPTFVEEARSLEPALAAGLAACRLETAYPVPPRSATAAYASLARRHGADLRIGLAAQPWLEQGRASGVVLEDGSRVAADAVLVAAGPWTHGSSMRRAHGSRSGQPGGSPCSCAWRTRRGTSSRRTRWMPSIGQPPRRRGPRLPTLALIRHRSSAWRAPRE